MPVKPWDQFSQLEKDRYAAFNKTMPTPNLAFDNDGHRFAAKHLDYIRNTIILFPLEHMANYADRSTYHAIEGKDESFLHRQFKEILEGYAPRFNTLTATDIGNLAIVFFKWPDPAVKTKFKKVLDDIYDWHRHSFAVKNN